MMRCLINPVPPVPPSIAHLKGPPLRRIFSKKGRGGLSTAAGQILVSPTPSLCICPGQSSGPSREEGKLASRPVVTMATPKLLRGVHCFGKCLQAEAATPPAMPVSMPSHGRPHVHGSRLGKSHLSGGRARSKCLMTGAQLPPPSVHPYEANPKTQGCTSFAGTNHLTRTRDTEQRGDCSLGCSEAKLHGSGGMLAPHDL